MRNFLIAKSFTTKAIDALSKGDLGIYDLSTGVPVAGVPKKSGLLALGCESGNHVLPIYKNKVSYVQSTYVAATAFSQTVKVVSQNVVGDYTLIIAKKGVGFNERNKWTANVHVNDAADTAAVIATKLTAAINATSESSGVTATVSGDTITVTGVAGVDYKLIPADYLTAATLGTATKGKAAINDAAYIKDLHAKAAADLGFNDVQQFTELLYKGYDINPLAGVSATDYGFDVVTIKFAEPRETRTVDQDVMQIIQVAFPRTSTGANAGLATFVAKVKEFAGETTAAS